VILVGLTEVAPVTAHDEDGEPAVPKALKQHSSPTQFALLTPSLTTVWRRAVARRETARPARRQLPTRPPEHLRRTLASPSASSGDAEDKREGKR
jgi:hypothetical protein